MQNKEREVIKLSHFQECYPLMSDQKQAFELVRGQ